MGSGVAGGGGAWKQPTMLASHPRRHKEHCLRPVTPRHLRNSYAPLALTTVGWRPVRRHYVLLGLSSCI